MIALLLPFLLLPFDGNYSAWQRPFIGLTKTGSITAFVSADGQAYENRNAVGAITTVHVRYQGECYLSRDARNWDTVPCHQFIAIDAAFRVEVQKHLQRGGVQRT